MLKLKRDYIELRGHQVWSAQGKTFGKKKEVALLMHGGLSSTESWDYTVIPALARTHEIFAYDRSAHGRTASREGFYHFDFQTDEAIAYIEDVIKGPTHLIGWSDGGIISLMIALKRPDLVKSIVAIGTNFHFDSGLSLIEENPEIIITEDEAAKFALRSPDPAHMQEVIIRKAYEVWNSEPTMTTAQLARISCPVLVLTGDDEPFSNNHTIELYEAIPNGRLAIIPGTSHFVVKEKPKLVQALIKDFYQNLDYPLTTWPRLRKDESERLTEGGEN